MKNGRLMPCDVSGVLVNGMKCNKDLCWKGAFCWQCRLKNGSRRFKSISLDKLKDVVCEGKCNFYCLSRTCTKHNILFHLSQDIFKTH